MKTKTFYFYYSAGSIYQITFVRWHRMRMQNGRENNFSLGVGMVGASDLLTRTPIGYWKGKPVYPRIDHGCVRGQMVLRPYTELYRSYNDACKRIRPVKRPSLKHLERLIRRRERYKKAKHGK